MHGKIIVKKITGENSKESGATILENWRGFQVGK